MTSLNRIAWVLAFVLLLAACAPERALCDGVYPVVGNLDELFKALDARVRQLRRDGFASINADDQTGRLVTRPLGFEGKRLHINAEVAEGGSIQVGFLSRDGRNPVEDMGPDDCTAITGDAVDVPVSWQAGSDVSALAGTDPRLDFRLRRAKIYSFWIE